MMDRAKNATANPHRSTTGASAPRLRTLTLPAEHGSWGLTLEPILLGLLVAPSWAGAALALGAFATFLLRVPLRAAQAAQRQGRRERLNLALRVAALYGLVAAAGLFIAIILAGWRPLLPLIFAVPFGIVFFIQDSQNQSRSWQAELAGPIGFAAIASSIALMGGQPLGPALALWAVLVARAITSVLFVRTRLRLDRNRPYQAGWTIAAHGAALLAIGLLVYFDFLPLLVVGVFALLLVRTVWGLSRFRRAASIQTLGFLEVGWGLVTVLSVAVGA